MNFIGIKALFIVRKSEMNTPELLVAWDEYSIDNWPEGWDKACKDALNELGDEVYSKGIFTIKMNQDRLMDQLISKPMPSLVGKIEAVPENDEV